MRHLFWLIAAVMLASSWPVLADTKLVYESGDKSFAVKIRAGEVRIDDEDGRWQLYRQSNNSIYSVDPQARAYTRMDADAAQAIRSQMQDLRDRMDQKLSQLPPQQREQARAMLADQLPGLDDAEHEINVERTGNTDSVAGYQCEIVQVLRDGKPRETLCVSQPQTLDISDAEFETVGAMFSLLEKMLAGTGLEHVGLPYLNLGGMPIRYTDNDTGQTRLLTDVSHEDLPGLAFQIPSGYQAQRPPGVSP